MATKAQCERALDLFEDELSNRKHVVGLGIVPMNEKKPSGGKDLAVAVYVKKKLPPERLKSKDLVPETLALPGRRVRVQIPTKVIEQVKVHLEPAFPPRYCGTSP